MAKLGDLCDILNGYAFKSEKYVNSGIRIIRIANVQKGYIEDSAPVFYPLDNNEYKKYELTEGDLLLSLTGNVGRVALLQKEFLPAALNQRVACLRIKDETTLNKSFLFNFLNSDYFENKCIESAKGVAQKNMSTEWLKDYEMPLFSMETQKKISNELDQISNLISLRKQQLSKLDELVKSRFIELFGDGSYPQIPLIQLMVEGAGLSYGIIVPGDNVEDGVPMVRPSDFNNGELCLDNVYRVAPEIEAKYSRTRLIGNEILVQVIGQPGQIMLSDIRCKGMNVTRNLAVVRPDCNRINRIYLKTYMQSQEAQAFMLGETKQSTLKQLPLSRLKELEIPVPPMELQKQFAAFVEQTDKSKFEIQKSLEKLETLKKALMQKYFG